MVVQRFGVYAYHAAGATETGAATSTPPIPFNECICIHSKRHNKRMSEYTVDFFWGDQMKIFPDSRFAAKVQET